MFDLTRQERFVLIFLALAVLSGTAVQYSYKRCPQLSRMMDILEEGRPLRKTDLNRAKVDELVDLPLIGPVLAGRIIDYREAKGGFESVEELKNIPGITDKGFEKISGYLKVSQRDVR